MRGLAALLRAHTHGALQDLLRWTRPADGVRERAEVHAGALHQRMLVGLRLLAEAQIECQRLELPGEIAHGVGERGDLERELGRQRIGAGVRRGAQPLQRTRELFTGRVALAVRVARRGAREHPAHVRRRRVALVLPLESAERRQPLLRERRAGSVAALFGPLQGPPPYARAASSGAESSASNAPRSKLRVTLPPAGATPLTRTTTGPICFGVQHKSASVSTPESASDASSSPSELSMRTPTSVSKDSTRSASGSRRVISRSRTSSDDPATSSNGFSSSPRSSSGRSCTAATRLATRPSSVGIDGMLPARELPSLHG